MKAVEAFTLGVATFCKEAGFDADDRRELTHLLFMSPDAALPVLEKIAGNAPTGAMPYWLRKKIDDLTAVQNVVGLPLPQRQQYWQQMEELLPQVQAYPDALKELHSAMSRTRFEMKEQVSKPAPWAWKHTGALGRQWARAEGLTDWSPTKQLSSGYTTVMEMARDQAKRRGDLPTFAKLTRAMHANLGAPPDKLEQLVQNETNAARLEQAPPVGGTPAGVIPEEAASATPAAPLSPERKKQLTEFAQGFAERWNPAQMNESRRAGWLSSFDKFLPAIADQPDILKPILEQLASIPFSQQERQQHSSIIQQAKRVAATNKLDSITGMFREQELVAGGHNREEARATAASEIAALGQRREDEQLNPPKPTVPGAKPTPAEAAAETTAEKPLTPEEKQRLHMEARGEAWKNSPWVDTGVKEEQHWEGAREGARIVGQRADLRRRLRESRVHLKPEEWVNMTPERATELAGGDPRRAQFFMTTGQMFKTNRPDMIGKQPRHAASPAFTSGSPAAAQPAEAAAEQEGGWEWTGDQPPTEAELATGRGARRPRGTRGVGGTRVQPRAQPSWAAASRRLAAKHRAAGIKPGATFTADGRTWKWGAPIKPTSWQETTPGSAAVAPTPPEEAAATTAPPAPIGSQTPEPIERGNIHAMMTGGQLPQTPAAAPTPASGSDSTEELLAATGQTPPAGSGAAPTTVTAPPSPAAAAGSPTAVTPPAAPQGGAQAGMSQQTQLTPGAGRPGRPVPLWPVMDQSVELASPAPAMPGAGSAPAEPASADIKRRVGM